MNKEDAEAEAEAPDEELDFLIVATLGPNLQFQLELKSCLS